MQDIYGLLQEYDVDAYINGHQHRLEHIRSKEGIDFFCSGTGALEQGRGNFEEHPETFEVLFHKNILQGFHGGYLIINEDCEKKRKAIIWSL